MLLFVSASVYASEMKSDEKTTQAMEEENKTVRVGYFPYANFQEGGYGEHKQGAGYEYLQKISYITGWKYEYVYGSFKECKGETSIFIYPGYKFGAIDAQITNFHLPKSTLIMLVSAFAGREFILSAYQEAVKERYRFFSFGDSMFIYGNDKKD